MFVQINPHLMKESERDKIWFRNSEKECDVFIWMNTDDKIARFQFWYQNYLIEWNLGQLRSGRMDAIDGSFKNYQARSYHYDDAIDINPVKEICEIISDEEDSELLKTPLNFILQQLQFACI